MPASPYQADPRYEAMLAVNGSSVRMGQRFRPVKVAAYAALACLGVLAVVLAWTHSSKPASRTEDVIEEFQFQSFPSDCGKQMRYGGCEKKRWACEEDDGTLQWKCCCQDDAFPGRIPASVPSTTMAPIGFLSSNSQSAGASSASERIFRLQETADVCLGWPEVQGTQFSFAVCGKSNTRFTQSTPGHGIIQLASNPTLCMGVRQGVFASLEITTCAPGGTAQMFQLTNGDKGMLQWSQGGDKCLDSEDGNTQAGSKITLADCIYYPLKPSQVFVLEVPPPEPVEEEEDEEEDSEDGDDSNDTDTGDEGKRRKPVLDPPSLFCISLMMPRSYEVGMLKAQLNKSIGIFACDEWAVYSNESVELRAKSKGKDAVVSDVMNGSLWAPIGGAFHTALNTPIFRRLWKRVIEDPKAWRNEWIAKLDPDCVFFPDRLKQLLRAQWAPTGTSKWAAWLNNCQLGLHGPIEVFNGHALGVYHNQVKDCDKVAEKHGQEDVYLAHCFKEIGVGEVAAYNLLLESEWACNERPSSQDLLPPCFARQVAFHPFKTVKSYMFCHERASKMSWSTPMYVMGDVPSSANHHHT